MEPALATGVPSRCQALQTPAGELNQVLLQWSYTERVADLEISRFAVRPLGVDEELAVLLEEAGGLVKVSEGGVVEVPEHGILAGVLHGEIVVGAAPVVELLLMAFRASLVGNEGGVF